MLAVMRTLRFREQISLTEMYYRIITSDEFKGHVSSCPTIRRKLEGTSNSSKPSDTIVHQNMEFLRSVLLSVSSVFIIQEDGKKCYLF